MPAPIHIDVTKTYYKEPINQVRAIFHTQSSPCHLVSSARANLSQRNRPKYQSTLATANEAEQRLSGGDVRMDSASVDIRFLGTEPEFLDIIDILGSERFVDLKRKSYNPSASALGRVINITAATPSVTWLAFPLVVLPHPHCGIAEQMLFRRPVPDPIVLGHRHASSGWCR